MSTTGFRTEILSDLARGMKDGSAQCWRSRAIPRLSEDADIVKLRSLLRKFNNIGCCLIAGFITNEIDGRLDNAPCTPYSKRKRRTEKEEMRVFARWANYLTYNLPLKPLEPLGTISTEIGHTRV